MSLRKVVTSTVDFLESILPSRVSKGDSLILAYHNIVPDESAPIGERVLHLGRKAFAQQIRLVRQFSDVVPLMDILERKSANETRVAITFDDAYASALRFGVAECGNLNLPCTVFVAPALLGTVPYWDQMAGSEHWERSQREHFLTEMKGRAPMRDFDEANDSPFLRIAEEGEILEAVRGGQVSLGNHSYSHLNLREHSAEAVEVELSATQRWLAARFPSETIPVVAYPYGYPPHSLELPLDGCIKYGLLADGGWMLSGIAYGPSRVPRWNVSPSTLSRFAVHFRGPFRRACGPSRFCSREQ